MIAFYTSISYHCFESWHLLLIQDLMYPPPKFNMQPEKLPCQPENRLPFFRVYVKLWGGYQSLFMPVFIALRSGSLAGRSWKRTRVGICVLLGGLGSIFFWISLACQQIETLRPKNVWDVMGFQKIQNPSVLRPFSGCHERRVWCFHGTGFLGLVASNGWSPGFIVWHTKFREKPFWGGYTPVHECAPPLHRLGSVEALGSPFCPRIYWKRVIVTKVHVATQKISSYPQTSGTSEV